MLKRIITLSLVMILLTLSSFTKDQTSIEAPKVKTSALVKISLPKEISVFSSLGQKLIKQQLLGSIPCARGACVCTQWYPASGNINTGYYRQCGCYGEMNNYWTEYKPCGYCVPEPNWGEDCQNG